MAGAGLSLTILERWYACSCAQAGLACVSSGDLRWYDWLSADQMVRIFCGEWPRLAHFQDDLLSQILRLPRPVSVLVPLPYATGFEAFMDGAGMEISLEAAGMRLGAWPDYRPADLPPGCSFAELDSPEQLREYAQVVGTHLTGHRRPQSFWVFSQVLSAMAECQTRFLAVLDDAGHIIATTSLYFDLATASAGIYHVVTLPQWRGRGLAESMVRLAVERARQAGMGAVILQVSQPNARRIYEKIGFSRELDYCRWTRKEYKA